MSAEKQLMKAIDIQNSRLVYTDMPMPSPRKGEVLIKIKAAGVNRPDILQRQGNYSSPAGASDILGLEVAGIIEDTGEKVCALLEGGGYAEYVCASRSQCLPIPENLSFEEAACLPECVFTVWKNIFIHGGFKKGDTVLLHGGSSGIGTTAIQMIKAFGGFVIVTCGSNKKIQACITLGADLAINYKAQDFVIEVLKHTNQKGVDIVLDIVGGDYLRRNLDCLGNNGRHVSIAFLRGAKSEIIIPQIMKKQLTLTGSMLRPASREEKSDLTKEIFDNIWPKIKKELIKPVIFKVFDLKDATQAHETLEKGDHIGKIVLSI